MKEKVEKLIVGLIFLALVFGGAKIGIWAYDQYDTSHNFKGIDCNEEYKLNTNINTIKEGIPYAIKKAKEYREGLNLDYIKVEFKNNEQFQNKKGVIMYSFYEEGIKQDLDANADVYLDMSSNSIKKSQVSYGTSKELLGGGIYLDVDKWTIDVGQAIDIFIDKMKENGILDYKASNIVIRCFQKSWEVALLTGGEMSHDRLLIKINPETGMII